MKKLMALAALLFAVGCAPTPPTPWEFACAAVDEELGELTHPCADLEKPTVVISKIVSPSYHGVYYLGEPYVFVNSRTNLKLAAVEVHETVHYILWEAGLERNRCHSEELARKIEAKWSGTGYSEEWRELYMC